MQWDTKISSLDPGAHLVCDHQGCGQYATWLVEAFEINLEDPESEREIVRHLCFSHVAAFVQEYDPLLSNFSPYFPFMPCKRPYQPSDDFQIDMTRDDLPPAFEIPPLSLAPCSDQEETKTSPTFLPSPEQKRPRKKPKHRKPKSKSTPAAPATTVSEPMTPGCLSRPDSQSCEALRVHKRRIRF